MRWPNFGCLAVFLGPVDVRVAETCAKALPALIASSRTPSGLPWWWVRVCPRLIDCFLMPATGLGLAINKRPS